jgi:hypothetical protein
MSQTKQPDYEVVWSGRDSLLPDRAERWDNRFSAMPTFDIDDGQAVEPVKAKRKYTRTGKYKGLCSRTNPNAPQYLPKTKGAKS